MGAHACMCTGLVPPSAKKEAKVVAIVPSPKAPPSTKSAPSSASSSSSSKLSAPELQRSSSGDEDFDSSYNALPSSRAKVVDILTGSIKLSLAEGISKFLALDIEDCINSLYDAESDTKRYREKVPIPYLFFLDI